jgi:microcin C transport system permease protein
MIFSPLFQKRLQKFINNKRAYYSFIFLIGSYFLSLFSPLLINNKPIILNFEGKYLFPIFFFYSDKELGGDYHTEPNYKEYNKKWTSFGSQNWMIFPPLKFGVNEDHLHDLKDGERPPSRPNSLHWMGTDDRGRDVFTRIVYGYRLAMTFSLILVFIELILAILIGGIQGYLGGWVDLSLQRFIEILSSIPFLYMILIFGAIFGRGFGVLLVTYAIFNWIGLSYYMRGEFLKLRNQTFVESARVLGVRPMTIIVRHILPNAITPLVTFLPFTLISSISILSALDFLGYGIPAPNPSWGELLGQGRERLSAWWLIGYPSLALFLVILLSAFIGEGLRDAFDPREKVEYED